MLCTSLCTDLLSCGSRRLLSAAKHQTFVALCLQHASQRPKAKMHSWNCPAEPILQYSLWYVSIFETHTKINKTISAPYLPTCVCVCVCVCVSASHWRPGPAALSRPASAQPDRWQSSAQWWRVWRYGSMLFILCDSERNDLISYFLWVCRVWSNLSLFSARHTGGHEGRVPEVRLSGFSAHSKGEPRERTGETVDLWTRKLLNVSIKVGTRGDTGE